MVERFNKYSKSIKEKREHLKALQEAKFQEKQKQWFKPKIKKNFSMKHNRKFSTTNPALVPYWVLQQGESDLNLEGSPVK